MGWKKTKQNELKETSAISQGIESSEQKHIEQLENKVDKLLEVMAGMDERVKEQEARTAIRDVSPISPLFRS